MDFNLVGGWLQLTTQEFEVLKSIYAAGSTGGSVSPARINEYYARDNGKTIQKQNLHKILRRLTDAGLIQKHGQADYRANIAGIKNALETRRETRRKELTEFEKILADVEGEFRRHVGPRDTPRVDYMRSDTLYDSIATSLGKAGLFHVVASFPSIAYPPNLSAKLGRTNYGNTLADRCLGRNELTVRFLTDLDVDYLFVHAFRALDNPAAAFKLADNILSNLENLIESDSPLDVRYHPDPHGLDVAIPVMDEPTEFYLFTRDEHHEIAGAIHIKNREASKNALHSFLRNFEYAEKTTDKHITDAKTRLKQKYGILEK